MDIMRFINISYTKSVNLSITHVNLSFIKDIIKQIIKIADIIQLIYKIINNLYY